MKSFAALLAMSAISACAFAQGPPELPQNHWAAKAVADLYRLGILVGYPDGIFRGPRPTSRYEMAQAIDGLRNNMLVEFDRLTAAIEDLEERPVQRTDVEGLADVRRRLDALNVTVSEVQALRPQIDGLQKQFEGIGEEIRRLRESIRETRAKLKG